MNCEIKTMSNMMIILAIFSVAVLLFAIITLSIFGAESNSKIDYVGTNAWLIEVDKCVDLYQETEQNETLYYKCMNGIDGVNTE